MFLEIFDNDGNAPDDAPGGSFPSTAGCDANQDAVIDAGDISCIVLTVFNGAGTCAAALGNSDQGAATLTVTTAMAQDNTLKATVQLTNTSTVATAATFTLAFDPSRLQIDSTDADGDSIPDAIIFVQSTPQRQVLGQIDEEADRINLSLADVAATPTAIADGTLAIITFTIKPGTAAVQMTDAITFDPATPASLGNADGQSVLVITQIIEATSAVEIYLPVVTNR